MPVLVVGAETGLGRATVRALRRAGGEVRAWVDADAPTAEAAIAELRAQGCKTATGTADDEGRLETAMEQVHTVAHCAGGPLRPPEQELDELATTLAAALGARCRRLVWASHIGADAPGGDAYLEACAEGEALLGDAEVESVVIRRALTYGTGDPLGDALSAGAGAEVRPDARHAPLHLDDLAAAFASADQLPRGGPAADLAVLVDVAGPEVVPFRAVRAALGRGRSGPRLPATTAALYSRDLVGGPGALGRDARRIPAAVG